MRHNQRMLKRLLAVALVIAAAGTGSAGMQDPIDKIREADLKADLFTLAGDAMRGREGGTLDEMTASAWVAERAREAGLLPAGDNGTYFQFFPLERFRVSAGSTVTLDGKALRMGRDVVTDAIVAASVDAPVTVASGRQRRRSRRSRIACSWSATRRRSSRCRVRARAPRPRFAPGCAGSSARRRRRRRPRLSRSCPTRPSINGTAWRSRSLAAPTAWILTAPRSREWRRAACRCSTSASLRLAVRSRPTPGSSPRSSTDSFTYPSVNIVAKVPGRDARLKDEYVLFSAHQDHDGERYPVNGDAIWNGADDNATTAVALLAIGRAMSAQPGRRSALFVWHGSEERGLMGSRWYVKHPTVPLKSIVAVLNGDMMGRNDPTTAALLGALPPHRNSPELVQIALDANKAVSRFVVDSSWDDPQHREGWYYRSDHLPYARAGVPALFFTTLLHPDYHTPFDNPDRIDIAKLAKMTRWMYATGRAVAEADKAPAFDPAFKLERCRDSTGNYCGG